MLGLLVLMDMQREVRPRRRSSLLGILSCVMIGVACQSDHSPVARGATGVEPAPSKRLAAATDTNQALRFHQAPKPLARNAVCSDWATFLGPTHNAKSPETKLLKHWPESGPSLVWERRVGSGYAAPAVAGGRLVYYHRVGDEARLDCLEPETGALIWTASHPCSYRDRYEFSNGPRARPVIDGDRIYTVDPEGKLHCWNLATGDIVWKNDTKRVFNVRANFFGVGSTPLVMGDLLIMNVGGQGGPCVVAFNKRNGEVVWRAGDLWGDSYASPIPAVIHGEPRLFVFAGGASEPPTGGLLSIDPRTGNIDGRFPFRAKRYESVSASSPVVLNDQVLITSAYRTGSALLNLSSSGSLELAWKSQGLGAEFATPIFHDGYLYGFDGGSKAKASLVCLNPQTGKRLWQAQPSWEETVIRHGKKQSMSFGIYRGSLLYADGHLLCLSEMGHLLWLDLSPEGYKEISRARLFTADESFTMPVLSRGLLYVTQNKKDMLTGDPPRLLCYDLRGRD